MPDQYAGHVTTSGPPAVASASFTSDSCTPAMESAMNTSSPLGGSPEGSSCSMDGWEQDREKKTTTTCEQTCKQAGRIEMVLG
jgi:hypothetical protein